MGHMAQLDAFVRDDPEYQAWLNGEWFTTIIRRYLGELEEGGIDDPLMAPVSVVAVLDDLYRIAGVPMPVEMHERIA